MRRPSDRVIGLIACFSITLLGLVVRLLRPLDAPLWYDEAATWAASRATWWQLLVWQHHFEHPPLSFALVKISTTLFGEAEPALRLPSFLIGVATIPVGFCAGQRLAGRMAGGVLMALLLAGDFGQITQAGHARMYTMLTLSVLLILALAAKLPETKRQAWRHGLALAVALTIGVLANNLGLMLIPAVAALATVGASARPKHRGAIALSATIALVVTLVAASPGLAKLAGRAGGHGPGGGEVVEREPDYVSHVEQEADPDLERRSVALDVWSGLAVDLFGKDKGVSIALLSLGTIGIGLALRRQPVQGTTLATLLLLTAIALPVALRWHHSTSGRYLLLAQLACFGGVAAMAGSSWTFVRATASLFALVLACWGSVGAVKLPVERQAISGTLMRDFAGEIGGSDLLVHSPKLRRVASYYGVEHPVVLADAPPPASTGVVWLYVGHLRPHIGGSGPEPALDILKQAASDRGWSVDLRAAKKLMLDHTASLWRIDEEGVVAWTGESDDVERVDLTSESAAAVEP